MFEYSVWYEDEIFRETCKAKGRVRANSRKEAQNKIRQFYPHITQLIITPIIIEEFFAYDEEWDI